MHNTSRIGGKLCTNPVLPIGLFFIIDLIRKNRRTLIFGTTRMATSYRSVVTLVKSFFAFEKLY